MAKTPTDAALRRISLLRERQRVLRGKDGNAFFLNSEIGMTIKGRNFFFKWKEKKEEEKRTKKLKSIKKNKIEIRMWQKKKDF